MEMEMEQTEAPSNLATVRLTAKTRHKGRRQADHGRFIMGLILGFDFKVFCITSYVALAITHTAEFLSGPCGVSLGFPPYSELP